MSCEQQLEDAYQEWRRLAEAEGEAIRNRNWLVVADCQNALKRLQPEIIRRTDGAHAEWSRNGVNRESRENHVRGVITELIEIERRNGEWLDDARRVAQSQITQLEQAGATLRQIQRSYAPAPAAAWTSFS